MYFQSSIAKRRSRYKSWQAFYLLSATALASCGGSTGTSPASPAIQQVTVVSSGAPATTATPAPSPPPTASVFGATTSDCSARLGVNLSGAEFGDIGALYGWGYIYPDNGTLDYFKASGMTLIRLPVRWERLQPTPMAALNEDELNRLRDMLDRANTRGLKLIVDLHNYGRFGSDVLGSTALPASTLADFWQKLATRLSTHPALVGYGLMNEPHDMPSANTWPNAAQLAVDAIRSVDGAKRIYVAGDGWSSAQSWEAVNGKLAIKDPAGNFRYEAHQYFDSNNSGTYQNGYDADGTYASIGSNRLQSFISFLKRTGAKGFIGEYGAPATDTRYLAVLDGFLKTATDAGIDTAYWSAGPWWGSYKLSIQPDANGDKPQLAVLKRYMEFGKGCAL